MNKCPRCDNENLKEDYSYCPICGLKLEMTREQVIEQLKDLVKDRESFCVGDYDVVFEQDIQALEYAIKELERTAQEVPVQEQSTEWMETLAKKIATYLPTHDILSK